MEKKSKHIIDAFFTLIRAGLWEKEVRLLPFGEIDFDSVKKLAEEQSVVGIVAAGIEHIVDMKPTKKDVLQVIGQAMQLEQRNTAMNIFIGVLMHKMQEVGIHTVLVKGQGVAQCYERPLWRACGDVDLFFDAENYQKAKAYLTPLASHVDAEDESTCHLGMTIKSWVVELHGTMDTEISSRINKGLAKVQRDIFENYGVRIWKNDNVDVALPNPDNDIFIIFTHFIDHFYVGGVGLRQICDWCRLLWTYRDTINVTLLEQRLHEMGIMAEWKAFAAFAVKYLGMPMEAMPLYDEKDNLNTSLKRKADRICKYVMISGNFGHNKDNSYRSKYPRLIEKSITFFRRLGEALSLFTIFPTHTPAFFITYVRGRAKAVM